MKLLTRLPGLLLLLVLSHLTTAATSAANFGFGPPEVIKLDWSTRGLTPVDLNGDGLLDLAVINNDAGKIELLYQRPGGEAARQQKKSLNRSRWEPVLEDARFEPDALTVGFSVYDMVAQDLNADGRLDLAFTSGQVPLTIRYQSEDGEWVDAWEYDGLQALGWQGSIQAGDIDGDGSVELLVLSADAVRVFRHDAAGRLSEPEVYYTSGENPFNLLVMDASGDGRADLLYLSTDGQQVLAMREQIEGGQFGPERRHLLERPARMMTVLAASRPEPGALAVVNSRSGSLDFMRLAAPDDAASRSRSALEAGVPEIYPIFKKVRDPASYAIGDVDGDGETDLVVANPAGAKLLLFLKKNGRFLSAQEFPSISAISSLAVGRFYRSARASIIVLSEVEQTMGRSELDPGGRLSFPQHVKIGSHQPLVAGASDLDGDGYDELLLVTEDQGNYRLLVAAPQDRAAGDSPWEVLSELELAGVRRKPVAIGVLDVFGSAGSGLMVYVPREPPVLLGPADEGSGLAFREVARDSSIRESLFKALRPAETATFDIDGDGNNELVVARTGFARAFRIVDDQLIMVDQFNARAGSDVIEAVLPLRSASGVDRVALYVAEGRELQFLQRGSDGVFRYQDSAQVGHLDLQNCFVLPAANDAAGDAYLFAGEDRFWYFNDVKAASSWSVDAVYETDLEQIHYTHLAIGDFNLDQLPDLVALDGSEHVVDIVSVEDGAFRSRMFWQVFEQNMHYQGRTGANMEPREILIDDFTGDGLPDLVLLVHDRILIYPQQ